MAEASVETQLAVLASEVKHFSKTIKAMLKADADRRHDERVREDRCYKLLVFLVLVVCLFAGLNLEVLKGIVPGVFVVAPVAGGGALYALWPRRGGRGEARGDGRGDGRGDAAADGDADGA